MTPPRHRDLGRRRERFPCSSRAAFIGWVDSSSAERERVRRTIALFDEKDTGRAGDRDGTRSRTPRALATRARWIRAPPGLQSSGALPARPRSSARLAGARGAARPARNGGLLRLCERLPIGEHGFVPVDRCHPALRRENACVHERLDSLLLAHLGELLQNATAHLEVGGCGGAAIAVLLAGSAQERSVGRKVPMMQAGSRTAN